MILADAHNFAFVHIPKCAGSSMKRKLAVIDDTNGQFRQIGDHPAMGPVHFGHLTLSDLRAHFPEEYERLVSYHSMAIIRNPAERFISAIYQRLREFKHFPQSNITKDVFSREVEEVIAHLKSAPARLSLEYIHFNKQSDYVFHDGTQIVKTLFRLDRLDLAVTHIQNMTGVVIDARNRENVTTEIRLPWLLPAVRMLRRPYVALFPSPFREKVRFRLSQLGLYKNPSSQRAASLSSSAWTFLAKYYELDYTLHKNLSIEPEMKHDGALS